MLPLEHSAILSTFIKLPFSNKTFVLSSFLVAAKGRFYCILLVSGQVFIIYLIVKCLDPNETALGNVICVKTFYY